MIKTQTLSPFLLSIIRDKATEPPFTGLYTDTNEPGTYLCRQCGLALFQSTTKFHSGCGWAAFDDEMTNAVKHEPDADGQRIEILCKRCNAHLGHIFQGEGFTFQNVRYCVNSLSLDFVADVCVEDTEEAIFAAGCFWGVEYFFKKLSGILKTEVGYTGGQQANPSYEEVCAFITGHFEAIRVIYNPKKINYESVAKYFFEIHDPTQTNGQGPDIGQQYLSAIFYYNEYQKTIAQSLTAHLKKQGYAIATQLLPATIFWPAENYHQAYYHKTGKAPYCHRYVKRF
jgi:peptide methionine sulfoxide reductase msrA/msrB